VCRRWILLPQPFNISCVCGEGATTVARSQNSALVLRRWLAAVQPLLHAALLVPWPARARSSGSWRELILEISENLWHSVTGLMYDRGHNQPPLTIAT
jgi:hypothetical protein